jgi:hypothetical protein
MAKRDKTPRYMREPASNAPRIAANPDSYLKQTPVWRFSDFDWDGPWGHTTCVARGQDGLRKHIEEHLANFESMTWEEILRATGGRGEGKGNNSHSVMRGDLSAAAQKRLDEKNIYSDELFSLRLESCVRIYGLRQGNCLKLVFFDIHHCEPANAVYPTKN